MTCLLNSVWNLLASAYPFENLLIDVCRLTTDGQDFFTSYDEVYDTFDAMGLKENLLRGIYAYGKLH